MHCSIAAAQNYKLRKNKNRKTRKAK